MAAYILGVIRENKKIVGYRVFSLTSGGSKINLRDVSASELKQLLSSKPNAKLANAQLNAAGDIEFTQGAIGAYPVIDTNGVVTSTAGLTIVYAVVDDKDKILGYGVVDTYGLLANVTKKTLIRLAYKYRCTNWEVYSIKSGEQDIRAKSGTFIRVVKQQVINIASVNSKLDSKEELDAKLKQNEINAAKLKEKEEADAKLMKSIEKDEKEDVKAAMDVAFNTSKTAEELIDRSQHISSEVISLSSNNILPGIKVYDLADCFDGEFNKDAQIKLTEIKSNLRNVSPYYASMMEAIPKVPCMAVETMGVTEDTLYYSPKFLATLSKGAATFIYIHEMLHIAMQHSVRHGKRNNVLWNIACDLYINEVICRDFGVQYGGAPAQYSRTSALDNRTYSGVIQTPSSGIFLSTIGESLDFARDTAETIYARLLAENPDIDKMMQQGQGNQQGQNGQQGGQQGSQQQGQQQQSQQGQQGQGNQNGQQQSGQDGQQLQGQGGQQGSQQQGQQQQGQGSGGQGQQGQQSGQGQNSGSLGGSDDFGSMGKDASSNGGSSELKNDTTEVDNAEYHQESVEVEISYNGKKLRAKVPLDVMSNRTTPGSDNPKQSMNETKTMLKRIKVKREMDIQQGKDMSLTSGSEMVEREIDFALSVSYNWEQILRNLANKKPRKTYTLASPNVDYSNMGVTLATRQRIGKKTQIAGLKVCVDVSGSIGEKELHKVFSKVKQILDSYEVSAEMIYWDTEITNAGDFEDMKSLLKIKPQGCGGTDVRCVFDYLLGRTKFNGKKEQTSLKDISGILIFTDGYIGNAYEEYARYFARTTYWVIDDGSPAFTPLFGKVAKAKLK